MWWLGIVESTCQLIGGGDGGYDQGSRYLTY